MSDTTCFYVSKTKNTCVPADDVRLQRMLNDFTLSVRTTNCLYNEDIVSLKDLIQKTEEDMLQIRNMGRKSLDELKALLTEMDLSFGMQMIEYNHKQAEKIFSTHDCPFMISPTDSRLLKHVDSLDLSIRSINCLKSAKINWVGDLIQKTEVELLKTPNFGRTSLREIQSKLSEIGLDLGIKVKNWPPSNIEELAKIQAKNEIISLKNCFEAIDDYVKSKLTDFEQTVYKQRIFQTRGHTLQSLADTTGVTRERIRQIENQIHNKITRVLSNNIVALHKFIDSIGFIVDYSIDTDNEDMLLIRKNSQLLYNLFQNSDIYRIDLKKQWLYKTHQLPLFAINETNLYSMDELVEYISNNLSKILQRDTQLAKQNFVTVLNKYIKQIILDNFIFIDGKRVANNKNSVLLKFLSQFSLIPVDISTLFREYHIFLTHHNIDTKKYGYASVPTFANILNDRKDVLISLGRKARYYNYQSLDISELMERLNLSDYKNTEVSCHKFFNENKELMTEYNILNAQELHNLLKKHCKDKDTDFSRMPIIKFGTVDREKQLRDFAKTISPINIADLATAYEEAFGIPKTTFIANYTQYLRDCTYRGVIIFENETNISNEQRKFILSALPEDFYFIDDVKEVFKNIFSDKYHEYMCQTILKSLGFYMAPQYILSTKYNSLREYILLKFDSMKIIDLNLYKQYQTLSAFQNWFYNKRNDGDLIKFMPHKFISSAALNKAGITKEMLLQYTTQVLECVNKRFFTVFSLKNMFKKFDLDKFGFEDIFYEDIIVRHSGISFTKINGVALFKNTTDKISLATFISSFMEHFRKVNIYDLIVKLKEEYGIFLEKHDLTQLVDETDLYYNNITENIYINYDEFITSF